MSDLPLIDELRATRRHLAEEQELDVERYAAMLREVARTSPGDYVTQPHLRPAALQRDPGVRNAG